MMRGRIFFRKLVWYVMYINAMGVILSWVTRYFLGEYHINAEDDRLVTTLSWKLILLLPYWGFREEVLFRLIPFALILSWEHIFSSVSNKIIFTVVIFSSVVFGVVHGDIRAIFVQGVTGMYLALIFWRYSMRLRSWYDLIPGLAASTVVHFSYNAWIFVPIFLGDLYRKHF